jgi:hypothetical protein
MASAPHANLTEAVLLLLLLCRYTSRAAACHFESALSAWETAAAAVLQREGILSQLVQLKAAMQDARQQQQQMLDPLEQQHNEPVPLLGLDAQQVHQLLWAFLAATAQVKIAAGLLFEAAGQQLVVGGMAYPRPGAVVSAAQMQPILDEAWELSGAAVINC